MLEGLNPAQISAVTTPASVVQVLAPPGSGKTKTLTARVAYLIAERGFAPCNIIVCTFTVKAAREMKERLRGLLGEGESKVILGTFHSVARRFLVSYGPLIGIGKKFGVADTDDSKSIIQRTIKRRKCTIVPATARARISRLKAQQISCDEYLGSCKKPDQEEFAAIYEEYERLLRLQNLLDYDDLLLRCAELLMRHPRCVFDVEAVLIDEFQDTNIVQFDLMRLFAQQNKCITIVGDPDQSIYGFRSAEIKNLKRMQQQYPETILINLEDNYRSSGSILLASLEIIEQDESRPPKKLMPTHCTGSRPVFRELPSSGQEGLWIVSEIKRSITMTAGLLGYNDFSILLRSASLSRTIESALGKAGLPYVMVGGHRFFDRMEIKIILDYLRVISQPEHNDALVRVINVPSRKIGEVTVKGLLDEAEERKLSLWSLLENAAKGNVRPKTKIAAQAMKGLEIFVNVVISSRGKVFGVETETISLSDLMSHVIKKVSFEEYLRRTHPEDFESRWANVQELIAQATDISAAIIGGENVGEELLQPIDLLDNALPSTTAEVLSKFLANVALSSETQRKDEAETSKNAVTISTIHAAKGLEWPVVFIPGAFAGSIPHSRAEDTDEERRLLYVAMTRAQALLYISCPSRNTQGEDTTVSPFLSAKAVARLMDRQGCSFTPSLVRDLSRILRREGPSAEQLSHSQVLAENREDDLWPLSDERENDEMTSWARSTEGESRDYESRTFKRRTFERKSSDLRLLSATSQRKRQTAAIRASVTLDDRSGISLSTSTIPIGFMSAGTHYSELKNQSLRQQPRGSGSSSQKTDEASKCPPLRKSNKLIRNRCQGSIASYFNKASSASSRELKPGVSQLRDIAPLPEPQPLPDISNSSLLLPTSVRAESALAPLHGMIRNERNASVDYVLLSSSPPRKDTPKGQSLDMSGNVLESAMRSEKYQNGSRFAPSLHVTSMMQAHQRTGPTRKTLGVRRSLNGWGTAQRVNNHIHS